VSGAIYAIFELNGGTLMMLNLPMLQGVERVWKQDYNQFCLIKDILATNCQIDKHIGNLSARKNINNFGD